MFVKKPSIFLLLVVLYSNVFAESINNNTQVYRAIKDFKKLGSGEVPYYRHHKEKALAIDAAKVPYRDKFARAETRFRGKAGIYTVQITTLGEIDGECKYRLLINGKIVASAQNAKTKNDYEPQIHKFDNITIPARAIIAVESNSHTNGLIPEGNGTAWARGRWTMLTIKASE